MIGQFTEYSVESSDSSAGDVCAEFREPPNPEPVFGRNGEPLSFVTSELHDQEHTVL